MLTILRGQTAGVWGVAFSPDGRLMASSSAKEVILWRKDGTSNQRLKGPNAQFSSVAISPDGQMIATVGADQSVKLWSTNGTLLHSLKGHQGNIKRVAFSPDGSMLASSSSDRTVKLWRSDGTEIATLRGHTAGTWGVAFSPDGSTLVSSSGDKTVKLWRLASVSGVNASSTTPDASSRETRPRHWLPYTPHPTPAPKGLGKNSLFKTLQGHNSAVIGVAFSPNGVFVATEQKTSLSLKIKLCKELAPIIRSNYIRQISVI